MFRTSPLDVLIEVTAVTTSTTPSGNKRMQVYVQTSLDGTNYSNGPTSGTNTSDEPNLYKLGDLPCNTVSVTNRRTYSVFAALGWVPPYFRLVCMNDLGTALSTGCSANYSTVVGASA